MLNIVNTYTEGNQYLPNISHSGSDTTLITWSSEGQDGSGYGIYGQLYAADGQKYGSEFLINSTVTNNQLFSDSVALTNGEWIVVWRSEHNNLDLIGQKLGSLGEKIGSEFQLNETAGAADTSIALLNDGSWIAVWANEISSGIFGRKFSSDGSPISSEFLISTNNNFTPTYPEITNLADGSLAVVWETPKYNSLDKLHMVISAQALTSDGSLIGGEFDVFSGDAMNYQNATITTLSGGGYVVAANSSDGIYLKRFDSDGIGLGGEILVNDLETTVGSPKIVGAEHGGWSVLWNNYIKEYSSDGSVLRETFSHTDYVSGSSYGTDAVYAGDEIALTWSADGDIHSRLVEGNETLNIVNTYTEGNQYLPNISHSGSDTTLITWSSEGQDGSGYGIYGQLYAADGQKYGSEFLINSTVTNNQLFSDSVALTNGEWIVVWRSEHNNLDLIGQKLGSLGEKIGSEFQLNETAGAADTSIALLNDGSWIAVWANEISSGIFGRKFSSDGSPISSEFLISTNNNFTPTYPEITNLADGSLAVVWETPKYNSLDKLHMVISAQALTSDGSLIGGEFDVFSGDAMNYQNATITTLSGGGYVVAANSSDGIYLKRFDSDGIGLGGEILVNDLETTVGSPKIVGAEHGGWSVLWNNYIKEYSSDGSVLRETFSHTDYVSGSSYGTDAVYAGDEIALTWSADGDVYKSRILSSADGNNALSGDGTEMNIGYELVTGGSGDDWLIGGSDADLIATNGGDDYVYGLAGDDRIEISGYGDVFVDTGEGADEIIVTGNTTGSVKISSGGVSDSLYLETWPQISNYYIDSSGNLYLGGTTPEPVPAVYPNPEPRFSTLEVEVEKQMVFDEERGKYTISENGISDILIDDVSLEDGFGTISLAVGSDFDEGDILFSNGRDVDQNFIYGGLGADIIHLLGGNQQASQTRIVGDTIINRGSDSNVDGETKNVSYGDELRFAWAREDVEITDHLNGYYEVEYIGEGADNGKVVEFTDIEKLVFEGGEGAPVEIQVIPGPVVGSAEWFVDNSWGGAAAGQDISFVDNNVELRVEGNTIKVYADVTVSETVMEMQSVKETYKDSRGRTRTRTVQKEVSVDKETSHEGELIWEGSHDSISGFDFADDEHVNVISVREEDIGGNAIEMTLGTDDTDLIFGTDGDNVIFGAGGDDLIVGGGGNDTILGGSGEDAILGGSGDDLLLGDFDEDVLRDEFEMSDDDIAAILADQLSDGSNNDLVIGGAGIDEVDGGEGNNVVISGGTDTGLEINGDGESNIQDIEDLIGRDLFEDEHWV